MGKGIKFAAWIVLLAAACGGRAAQTKGPSAPSGSTTPAAAGTCRKLATSPVAALPGQGGTSSTVVLASASGRTIAFVSDEDVHAVLTVDVDAKKQLAATPIDGTPGHMILTPDGRLLVTVRDKGRVLALQTTAIDKPLDM